MEPKMNQYAEAIWQKVWSGESRGLIENLNDLCISDDGSSGVSQEDYSTESYDGTTTVHFKHLDVRLIEHIREADIVVGCVAWLTHPDILAALATKKGVSLIVQKEDFLRPDLHAKPGWKAQLHQLYSQLPSTLDRYDVGLSGTVLYQMSCGGDPTLHAVRCVGNANRDKVPASPRAHHKFVVFCREIPKRDEDYGYLNYHPYAVWTGSFNLTRNAVVSFENALVLRERKIVNAFFHEYAQVAALSESLNWEDVWATPEWRIGT